MDIKDIIVKLVMMLREVSIVVMISHQIVIGIYQIVVFVELLKRSTHPGNSSGIGCGMHSWTDNWCYINDECPGDNWILCSPQTQSIESQSSTCDFTCTKGYSGEDCTTCDGDERNGQCCPNKPSNSSWDNSTTCDFTCNTGYTGVFTNHIVKNNDTCTTTLTKEQCEQTENYAEEWNSTWTEKPPFGCLQLSSGSVYWNENTFENRADCGDSGINCLCKNDTPGNSDIECRCDAVDRDGICCSDKPLNSDWNNTTSCDFTCKAGFSGPDCTSCLNGFSGANCDICQYGIARGVNDGTNHCCLNDPALYDVPKPLNSQWVNNTDCQWECKKENGDPGTLVDWDYNPDLNGSGLVNGYTCCKNTKPDNATWDIYKKIVLGHVLMVGVVMIVQNAPPIPLEVVNVIMIINHQQQIPIGNILEADVIGNVKVIKIYNTGYSGDDCTVVSKYKEITNDRYYVSSNPDSDSSIIETLETNVTKDRCATIAKQRLYSISSFPGLNQNMVFQMNNNGKCYIYKAFGTQSEIEIENNTSIRSQFGKIYTLT